MGDLRDELTKRRSWFLETQLRRLNLDTFIGLNAETPDPAEQNLLKIISEPAVVPGVTPDAAPLVYLDSQQPVWSADEHSRRNALSAGLIGRRCDWLDFREPDRLLASLAVLADTSLHDTFGSILERPAIAGGLGSSMQAYLPDRKDAMTDGNAQAIARATIAAAKPWLAAELYRPTDPANPEQWLINLEQFVGDVEAELSIDTGGAPSNRPTFDRANPDSYRSWMRTTMQRQLDQEPTAESTAEQRQAFFDTVQVKLLEPPPPAPDPPKRHPKSPGPYVPAAPGPWVWDVRVKTVDFAMAPAAGYPHSRKVPHWAHAVTDPLREVYVSKPDSDMGLVSLIRTLYLFGTIPPRVATGADLRWRSATFAGTQFDEFFAHRAADPYFAGDTDRAQRLDDARSKLRAILEIRADIPGAAAITFSPIVGRVLRDGLHHFKFWLDEPLRAIDDATLQRVRTDLGYGGDAESEMEYWSENHYLMFASNEYLAGQLWQADQFLPGKTFGHTDGAMDGARRRDRGKARVLTWLNHRLLFGWTEFNASGYLREHLWALLNLVDFALDVDVREKATVAMDLLLFDVARFHHKGAGGAAGGRNQFKSKACGWDNALDDALEILFGTRGMYCDGDSLIGVAMATTTYQVPEVLLEIGVNPPAAAVLDRSRVSISFDEAYRYGIWFSQESDETTSRRAGYAPKLARRLPFVAATNEAIAQVHHDYGAREDSTVFWWTTSSFMNEQIVYASLDLVDRFGLSKTGVWATLPKVLKTWIRLVKDLGFGGFFHGGLQGTFQAVAGLGPIGGLLESAGEDMEDFADEFATLLDGSSRTRANIVTYGNGDVMMSSIQNFRAGQLNYQSSVHQVTLNRALSVFTTAGFAGLDMSAATVAAAGFLAFGPIGSIVALGVEGGQEGSNVFGDDQDGPGWWTGYLGLPRIVQHRGVAIVAYQFEDMQETLAETQSHAWFPKAGFTSVAEARSAAYDDDNSFFAEPFDFSKNGHWLFGKVVHPTTGLAAADWPEAYVGVFSNKRPEWLTADEDHDADVYAERLQTVRDNPPDDDRKNRWGDIWKDPLPKDYFAGKDWNVEGDNVWIVHVGNKSEYGDFDQFKDRLRTAKVTVDDVGDLECTYHMPLPLTEGGGSQALRLGYGDGGEFSLDGATVPTDLFPRFESPYVRGENAFPVGNRVEWGQRAYVIEYHDKTLTHDFLDFDFTQPDTKPVRSEQDPRGDPDSVRALVIFLRTGDEEMDEFTVSTASVAVGSLSAVDGEIVAVGPVAEGSDHDAEWIYLDRVAALQPDLTLELFLDAVGDGDDDTEWKASYTIKALMADHRLIDCATSFPAVHFTKDSRRSGPLPLAVKTDRWRAWRDVPGGPMAGDVVLVNRPSWRSVYYDHCDLLVIDASGSVTHRRVPASLDDPAPSSSNPNPSGGPRFGSSTQVMGFSPTPGRVVAIGLADGRLHFAAVDGAGAWSPWSSGADLTVELLPTPVPFAVHGSLYCAPPRAGQPAVALLASGSDGDLHLAQEWRPGSPNLWRRLHVTGFTLDQGADCAVVGDTVFAIADDGSLWSVSAQGSEQWAKVSLADMGVRHLAVVDEAPSIRLLLCANDGQVWDYTVAPDGLPRWILLGSPGDRLTSADRLACVASDLDHVHLAVNSGGIVHVRTWTAMSDWGPWHRIESGESGFRTDDGGPLLVNRVNHQVELLVTAHDSTLKRTWWS